MPEHGRGRPRGFRSAAVVAAAALAGVAAGVLGARTVLPGPRAGPGPAPPARQAAVHTHGHEVMPFELDRTRHIFEMTTGGGIQDVFARSPGDTATVRLVRRHLRHEAARFGAGDFSDPASLHGSDMPGLGELSASAGRVRVDYRDIPAGGRITFSAKDIELVTAIHRWFGAQLSDHGSDATYR